MKDKASKKNGKMTRDEFYQLHNDELEKQMWLLQIDQKLLQKSVMRCQELKDGKTEKIFAEQLNEINNKIAGCNSRMVFVSTEMMGKI